MKLPPTCHALAAALLVTLSAEHVCASPAVSEAETKFQLARLAGEIKRRANPTGSYQPSLGACPPITNSQNQGANLGYIRDTRQNVVSANESDYVDRHRRATQEAWRTWLSSSNPGPNLDGEGGIAGGVQNYTSSLENLPKVGIALSGGGYRAMIHGAGYVMGLDGRNTTAQARGTAGFLQLASHISGLSGGSWAVGSLALNDWPTAQTLAESTWNLEDDLIVPADGKLGYYTDIVVDVAGKREEGFTTGIVDYWGRALSYHLVNDSYPDQGQATTWSDIRNTSSFQSAAFPFPVVVADEREAGELLIYRNTTVFEFNPYEFGSWDPTVAAFVPIDILGTRLDNGAVNQTGDQCTLGFENFGWVVGTSSTLFNSLYSILITSDGDSIIQDALESILGAVSEKANDVSIVPNPFRGWRSGEESVLVSDLNNITLVDGGEDNQNIPVNPLLDPARDLDFILAVDSSADSTDWPNGTALHETYLRYESGSRFASTPMPLIPGPNTFLNRGLNTRPVFFGCDSAVNVTNADTAANGVRAPIIAYVANYPWSSLSNTSTFQLRYTDEQTQQILDNAVDVATMGGETDGSIYWPTCLACAALQRSFERSNTPRPSVCNACLDAYCWDGVTNDTAPSTAYSPAIGTPDWVTSNGAAQVMPAFTGGNGSNADQSSAESPSTDAASSLAGDRISYTTVFMAAISLLCLAAM